MTNSPAAVNNTLTVDRGVTIQSGQTSITMTVGNTLTLSATSAVLADNGTVTLKIGTLVDGTGNIFGKIVTNGTANSAAVYGAVNNDTLNVDLATAVLPDGLNFDGGAGSNTFHIVGTTATDYFSVSESGHDQGRVLHATTKGGTADAVLDYANVQTMQIDGQNNNQAGYVTFNIGDTSPGAMTFEFYGYNGTQSGLQVNGAANAPNQIAVGDFMDPANMTATLSSSAISKVSPTDAEPATQVYNPATQTWTATTFTVAQRFWVKAADLALLQMFGGSADDILVNNTSIPDLLDGGAGNDTLVGGSAKAATSVLLGNSGNNTLYGRAVTAYLFGNYQYDPANKPPIVASPDLPGNYFTVTGSRGYAIGSGQKNTGPNVAIEGPGPLDVEAWLLAKRITAADVPGVINDASSTVPAQPFPAPPTLPSPWPPG